MMDEKLLNRTLAFGTVLVCASYFLPWASIMTPLGSVEVRGLYVDFAWALLIVGIFHLLVQFARINKAALGFGDGIAPILDAAWSGIPFIFIIFFAWYAAGFIFRNPASGADGSIFGVSLGSMIRVGLDYGFWIGVLGAILTTLCVGLLRHNVGKFASYGVLVVVIVAAAAFGLDKAGALSHPEAPSGIATDASTTTNGTTPIIPSVPALDSAPYVTITKITGDVLLKDIDAGRFNDTIVITPVFKNVGTKTIVGLQGHIAMVDGFGKEVYGFDFRDDDKLMSGKESTGGYEFDGNQFEDDDPYHKMLPLLNGSTAKYRWTISRIAFDDGTVLPK